jgi:hypothetical protein
MPWSTNPRISELINQFGGTQAAKPAANTDEYWASVIQKMGTPAALDTGLYAPAIMKAGEAGRDISEGKGVDSRLAAAGGGEQWALTNAAKTQGQTNVSNAFGQDVAKTTTSAVDEAGKYNLERARQTNEFNLRKAGEEGSALAKGSHYQVSPWLSVLGSLVNGAASGLDFSRPSPGTPGESINFGPDGYQPGYMPGTNPNEGMPGLFLTWPLVAKAASEPKLPNLPSPRPSKT